MRCFFFFIKRRTFDNFRAKNSLYRSTIAHDAPTVRGDAKSRLFLCAICIRADCVAQNSARNFATLVRGDQRRPTPVKTKLILSAAPRALEHSALSISKQKGIITARFYTIQLDINVVALGVCRYCFIRPEAYFVTHST